MCRSGHYGYDRGPEIRYARAIYGTLFSNTFLCAATVGDAVNHLKKKRVVGYEDSTDGYTTPSQTVFPLL